MFALCAPCSDASPGAEENLDLHEKAGILEVLLQLLHNPPPPPVAISFDEKFTTRLPKVRFESHTVIPLPLLSTMFELADKYVIDSPLVESLKVHLEAHAPAHPLQVYSFATHKIVRLQDFRVRALRELLLAEEIFPHGKYYLTWLERWVKLAPKVTANVHLTATKRWRVGIGSVRR